MVTKRASREGEGEGEGESLNCLMCNLRNAFLFRLL